MRKQHRRPLTVANIQNQTIERIPFGGDWYQAFKQPQNRGVWFAYGGSGSGKSTFMMQLAKELSTPYKTLYNLLEEETDDSDFIERTSLCQMQDVEGSFHAQRYELEELNKYLERRNSSDVVIIDSAPYFFKTWDEYWEFKQRWATKKIIVIVGHAEGKSPSTDLQKRIMYDAKMKIFISGYLATCKGRTIGPNGGRYIIWQEGYEKIHGDN
ncbi:ATP-binding protein [Tenacibaculum finnmarkense]|uniref:ATP-binding protein n=1 Tax=Tenacibaculum finnmarkense TaxID=2781243 RepID=UPI001EFAAD9F|nr:ATP-binding protein [Tenacibaculum finnmarkense]MCG8203410.1 ATP-binding protein [Tenacibaculum finnmarkense genomovar finnmarkense]MCG8221232.1 ATP-binding protein [Tenacibaculum finnmarkense genomovar finnmarkense]MCG8223923.1 ATP-binding protein [Tenacibaculum finnmarkense genomovar finnmarkense]MCG8229497.1 ATP-binding protein [Tenacibaculum finnmarkense genomovar finnmarkense]MCG8234944.1 ATP-binding protein [Tenacibaculum finnmarkense genomovar finnmarkense]